MDQPKPPLPHVASAKWGQPPFFLALLTLLLLLSTLFLAYQNMQLKKQIADLQTLPSSASNTPSLPTSIPISKIYPTPITNGEWKTYNRSSCGAFSNKYPFSIDIPANWTETINYDKENFYSSYTYTNDKNSFEITCGDGFGGGGCGTTNPVIQNNFIIDGKNTSGCMEQSANTIGLRLTYLKITPEPPSFSFTASINDTKNGKNLINQILSTFKFLEQKANGAYVCPSNGWVDCMPSTVSKPECSDEAMTWYKTNCPNFQGGAL